MAGTAGELSPGGRPGEGGAGQRLPAAPTGVECWVSPKESGSRRWTLPPGSKRFVSTYSVPSLAPQ